MNFHEPHSKAAHFHTAKNLLTLNQAYNELWLWERQQFYDVAKKLKNIYHASYFENSANILTFSHMVSTKSATG